MLCYKNINNWSENGWIHVCDHVWKEELEGKWKQVQRWFTSCTNNPQFLDTSLQINTDNKSNVILSRPKLNMDQALVKHTPIGHYMDALRLLGNTTSYHVVYIVYIV